MTIRVGFLFLGPASHVAHAASIAFELDRMDGYEAIVFVSSDTNAEIIRDIAKQRGCAPSMEWLRADPLHRLIRLFKKRTHPRVRYVIHHNRQRLQSLDVLVMMDAHPIRWAPDAPRPRLVFAGHGACIRANGHYPGMDQFDLLLLPGQTKFEQLHSRGLVEASRTRIIGYPKFDLVTPASMRSNGKLFANDRPIVVYNPHFNASQSSWTAWGKQVLDYFLGHTDFNLVFAPHLLLFGKRRRRASLPAKYLAAPNILVDLDGPSLTDMTYTVAADIYLGDVSSQVYEFVGLQPRPCIFLDPRGRSWENDDSLKMWQMGDVVSDLASLDDALRAAGLRFETYLPAQKRLAASAFDRAGQPSGQRGAQAIAGLFAG